MPKRRSDELAAIDEVMPLVDQFNTLEHAQRLIFLDVVDPLPEEVVPTKKSQKKASKKSPKSTQSSSKSPRATGIERQLKEQRERGPQAMTYCAHVFSGGEKCGESESSGIHDVTMGYQNYHPFLSAVPTAPNLSPANGGPGSGTVNSEASAASAGAATGGSNEG